MASEEVHASPPHFNHGQGESEEEEEACGQIFDGRNVVFFHDRLSIFQTDRKHRSEEVATRGVKLEEGVITIITGM